MSCFDLWDTYNIPTMNSFCMFLFQISYIMIYIHIAMVTYDKENSYIVAALIVIV